MGEVFWGLHSPLAARLIERFHLRAAIETGTYLGGGALQLAALCSRVWSIERDATLAEFAMATYGHVENLTILPGDASERLGSVLDGLQEPAFFFLDAHWFRLSPRASVRLSPQCRILEELEVIREHHSCIGRSVLMVDDAVMFLGSLPRPFERRDFPPITDVIERLRRLSPAFHVVVTDDVLIAGPPDVDEVVAEYHRWRDRLGFP